MLDSSIVKQLRDVFADLAHPIQLELKASQHAKHGELVTMAQDIAATSPHISVEVRGEFSEIPQLNLLVDGQANGIRFSGVPGGHEFTSLIMAILHSAKGGRQPDNGIIQRIKNLKGPISLRTFVSLSCTNCPEVVQALNLMASHHEHISHEMVDGSMNYAEVERLGLQGVPAVVAGDEIIHVGKADLASLLDELESRFGSDSHQNVHTIHSADVAVIGGGPAGAAAAIYSARKGLKTVIVAGRIGGQVLDTLGIENLISKPYTEGPQLASDMRGHLESAGVTVLDHRTVLNVHAGDLHRLHLKGGETVNAPQIVVATGAKWRQLGVPGEKEHIGHGVAFCPHCDGPFYKDKRVAVVGGGNSGVEAAIDLAGICSQVTLFEFGDEMRADQVLQQKLLSLPNVSVHTSARTTEVVGDGQSVSALRYEDRTNGQIHDVELDGIFVQIGLAPNSQAFADLVETNKAGEIVTDDRGRTSVPGIYAAGDVTITPYKQIVIAMGEGAKVALAAFKDRMRAA